MNLLLDLTIIIPNYNTKALLQQCLTSIYHYTRGIRFEVICIDDGRRMAARRWSIGFSRGHSGTTTR